MASNQKINPNANYIDTSLPYFTSGGWAYPTQSSALWDMAPARTHEIRQNGINVVGICLCIDDGTNPIRVNLHDTA